MNLFQSQIDELNAYTWKAIKEAKSKKKKREIYKIYKKAFEEMQILAQLAKPFLFL